MTSSLQNAYGRYPSDVLSSHRNFTGSAFTCAVCEQPTDDENPPMSSIFWDVAKIDLPAGFSIDDGCRRCIRDRAVELAKYWLGRYDPDKTYDTGAEDAAGILCESLGIRMVPA